MRDQDRLLWNNQQKQLRASLSHLNNYPETLSLFLHQHAMVHAASLTPDEPIHFQESLISTLTDAQWRTILPNGEHSLAWIFWHMARIEDMTMNLLIAGTQQVFLKEEWPLRLKISVLDSGNSMSVDEIKTITDSMDITELMNYRNAVALRTREIVQTLDPAQLKKRVDSGRLQQMLSVGAVRPAAIGLIEYWGGLKYAGLLLMPPTRHNFVHLNEARLLKEKLAKQKA